MRSAGQDAVDAEEVRRMVADAAGVAADDLLIVFRRVVDRTFNALSIVTDTSTSDTHPASMTEPPAAVSPD